ncbi:restriction endonuclease subunit R, partial [Butyricicoccus sp. 1XD8-22]
LNKGEKTFIDLLKNYLEESPDFLIEKSVHLLRNKSKTGMGFFEAGNFFPDFVLWIDTPDTQFITFIDPKGLMRVMPDDDKVKFHKKIKELEERLQPTSKDKTIVLNSFILSETPSSKLKVWWGMSKPELEAKNVLSLDNPDCIEVMFSKILN